MTGCNVLPTVSLSNIQTFAAVTYAWSMTKTANPTQVRCWAQPGPALSADRLHLFVCCPGLTCTVTADATSLLLLYVCVCAPQVQIPVGGGGSTQYNVQLTRTRSTANYAMGGTLTIINPATFAMYISSVTLMSTSGSFGALPPACLGGSNVAGSTISGITGPATGGVWSGRRRLLRKLLQWATGGVVNPWTTPTTVTPFGTTGMTGSFMIAAGAQIECQFNITAGACVLCAVSFPACELLVGCCCLAPGTLCGTYGSWGASPLALTRHIGLRVAHTCSAQGYPTVCRSVPVSGMDTTHSIWWYCRCCAGSGSPPQGQVYAQATTTSSFVTSTGNTAISSQIQVDFNNPTQQWEIAKCVTFR